MDSQPSDEDSVALTPRVGSRIGPYELLEVIGEGGMGVVYRALQSEPVRREVALKVIKLGMDTKEVVRRFESERQALAVMEHPNIARVFDGGSTETGRPYFVMELVDGVEITEYVDAHRLSTEERVRLFIDVCDAVQHAHQKGVIHRDLKPSNVLVSDIDGRHVCKVIDFGVARVVDHDAAGGTRITRAGHVLGTPEYMSPEQVLGEAHRVDTRADIYALGVILYELLCGALPREKRAYAGPALFGVVATDPPTPSKRFDSLGDTQETIAGLRRSTPQTLRRQLRGDLDWIVATAMAADRDRRYETARELALDLRRHLTHEPVAARPPTRRYRAARFVRRHRGPLAAAAALLVAILGGAALSFVGFVRAEQNAVRADQAAGRAEAVSDFLRNMLRAASPDVGEGVSTTVAEVLDSAGLDVARGALADRPLVEIEVRRTIGGTYLLLGLHDRADEHLSAALALIERTPDVPIRDHVQTLQDLGQLRRAQGDPAAAVAIQRQALALAEASLDESDGDPESLTNVVRSDLALALWALDRVSEAADLYEALAAAERGAREADPIGLATTLNNYALVKRAAGDPDGAFELFAEALEVLREAVGEDDRRVASVLESLGSLEQRAARYEAADSLMQLALATRQRVYGAAHPDIVNGLNGLGLLRLDMGDLDGAHGFLDRALQMSIDVLGDDHPRTASVLNSIGLVHLRANRAAAAEEAFRRAVAIRAVSLGPTHRLTLNAQANLASAVLDGGRPAEAAALARRIVETQDDVGLPDSEMRSSTRLTLGRALTELGRYEEAEVHLLQAFEMRERDLGLDHPSTLDAASSLEVLYERWDRPERVRF